MVVFSKFSSDSSPMSTVDDYSSDYHFNSDYRAYKLSSSTSRRNNYINSTNSTVTKVAPQFLIPVSPLEADAQKEIQRKQREEETKLFKQQFDNMSKCAVKEFLATERMDAKDLNNKNNNGKGQKNKSSSKGNSTNSSNCSSPKSPKKSKALNFFLKKKGNTNFVGTSDLSYINNNSKPSTPSTAASSPKFNGNNNTNSTSLTSNRGTHINVNHQKANRKPCSSNKASKKYLQQPALKKEVREFYEERWDPSLTSGINKMISESPAESYYGPYGSSMSSSYWNDDSSYYSNSINSNLSESYTSSTNDSYSYIKNVTSSSNINYAYSSSKNGYDAAPYYNSKGEYGMSCAEDLESEGDLDALYQTEILPELPQSCQRSKIDDIGILPSRSRGEQLKTWKDVVMGLAQKKDLEEEDEEKLENDDDLKNDEEEDIMNETDTDKTEINNNNDDDTVSVIDLVAENVTKTDTKTDKNDKNNSIEEEEEEFCFVDLFGEEDEQEEEENCQDTEDGFCLLDLE